MALPSASREFVCIFGGFMFAIIRTGGKQYRVQAGDTVRVEKLEKNLGDTFDLTDILMVGGDKAFIGEPVVKNAKVTVTVVRQAKDAKIIVFKKKRRQGYRRTAGHRQPFTELFVQAITSPEGQTAKAETKAHVIDPKKKAERQAAHVQQLKTAGKTAVVEAKKKKAAVKVAAKKKAVTRVAKKKTVAKKAKPAAKKTAKKASKK
jgi:large subunit ribosomal protein L21